MNLVGAIDYLRQIKEICRQNKGSCRNCPLGDKQSIQDCRCPRLIEPWKWTDEITTEMVRKVVNQRKEKK